MLYLLLTALQILVWGGALASAHEEKGGGVASEECSRVLFPARKEYCKSVECMVLKSSGLQSDECMPQKSRALQAAVCMAPLITAITPHP